MGPGGVPLADYGPRVGAALIDGLIVGVAGTIIYWVIVGAAGATGSDAAVIVTLFVGWLAYLAVLAAYTIFTMNRPGERNGQTLGKQVVDIRVVKEDGSPMDPGKIAMREVVIRGLLFGGISTITFGFGGIIYLLDVLWPLWDDQRRALHDMMAKTRVVKA